MSNEERRVPELRFKGFFDDWEQRKLGEVSEITGGGTPKTTVAEYWDGDINWYSPAEIGQQRFVKESQRKITKLGLQKSSAKVLPSGSVLFTSRAGIGNTAILLTEGSTNQGFQSIIPNKNELNTYFIYSLTHKLKKFGEITGAGSTFVEVSGKQMKKMPLILPKLDEQNKIGLFLKKLDNIITLHQKRINIIQQIKQSYLSSMFPIMNENIPLLRFVNFIEEWEQRKLEHTCDFTLGGGTPRTNTVEYWQGNTPWIQSSDIKEHDVLNVLIKKKINKAAIQNSSAKLIPKNSIAIVTRVGVGKLVFIPFEYTTSQDFLSLCKLQVDEKYLVYYLYQLLQKESNQTQGTSIKGITKNELLKRIVIIPPSHQEQNILGDFFENLDKTITLHQSKLSSLEKIKQSYLKKLFI